MRTIDPTIKEALVLFAWCLVVPVYLTALLIADALHTVPTV